MSHLDEWDLLCTTQDIEVGDTVSVVNYGVAEDWVYCGSNRRGILLKGDGGRERTFSRSLEEIGGPGFILGKSAIALRLTKKS